MEKISIIVPVYNSEKYINRCLNSIINQTYKNIEIILINDNSSDKSLDICKNHKDNRIIIINNNKNLGVSESRNIGIRKATGKYITFIDSDDYVELDYIETLHNLIKEDNYEISIIGYTKIINKNKCSLNNKEKYILNNHDLIKKVLNYEIEMSVCGKLYKKELLNKIIFPKNKIFEDINVFGKIIIDCNKSIFQKVSKYNYVIRYGSLSHSSYTKKDQDRIKFSYEFTNSVKEKYSDLSKEAAIYYINNMLAVSNKLLLINNYKNNIIKQTKKNILNNYFNIRKALSLKKKIQYILFTLNTHLYIIIYNKIKESVITNEKNNI